MISLVERTFKFLCKEKSNITSISRLEGIGTTEVGNEEWGQGVEIGLDKDNISIIKYPNMCESHVFILKEMKRFRLELKT